MVAKIERQLPSTEPVERRLTRSSIKSPLIAKTRTDRNRNLAPTRKAAVKRVRWKYSPGVSRSDSEHLPGAPSQDDVPAQNGKEDEKGYISLHNGKKTKNGHLPVHKGKKARVDKMKENHQVTAQPINSPSLWPKPRGNKKNSSFCRFLGKPLPREEAISKWPARYADGRDDTEREPIPDALRGKKKPVNRGSDEKNCKHHYSTASIDGKLYKLGDCVHVNRIVKPDYLGRIVELFELKDGSRWFCIQWFFRVEDTGVGDDHRTGVDHNPKRVFYSTVMDDNPLDCILGKQNVIRVDPQSRMGSTEQVIPRCDYFYDMAYNLEFSTFYVLPEGERFHGLPLYKKEPPMDRSETLGTGETSTISEEIVAEPSKALVTFCSEDRQLQRSQEFSLLDLYSGCGAMSTGLCNGCVLSGANLITRWAVDLNADACASLKFNHPETEVRNESAEDFLSLIKAWHRLCERSSLHNEESEGEDEPDEPDEPDEDKDASSSEVYEVEAIIGIRWVGASTLELKVDNGKSPHYVEKENSTKKPGVEFKVKWKNYDDPAEDTWEPEDNLSCPKKINDFIIEGQKNRILPLPGTCDVICGGPPCQGASGFNRYRNKTEPLKCVRNKQIIVYMDIVEFLKPRFVLMENVVDILKFANGVLGKYALSRLVHMHYQAKLGMLVAGCYGLPQFRMRVFLWGASPDENLPAFPLPTHKVVSRGHAPQNWEKNLVSYSEAESPVLENALMLGDAISDLPEITNSDRNDEMFYISRPKTKFQRLIRLSRHALQKEPKPKKLARPILFDHRSLELNEDDYQRVCQIPHRKGANFRDLKGIIIHPDGTVDVQRNKRALLPSGKPLVPDYAITFVKGKSMKPFGRLWWDETVSTVVTRAEPHNIAILHPIQDRVLSVRENARLQGFPDWYKLFGTVKQRYMQVGNAVAVPVARALGFSLGYSIKQEGKPRIVPTGSAALIELPVTSRSAY